LNGVDQGDLPRGGIDGLPTPEVGGWAREKYLRVWLYDQLFATGMKREWQERVYIDLFAGSGYSRVRGTMDILMSSPLLATQIPDTFDRYIFCDQRPGYLDALRQRVERHAPGLTVHYVPGNVDETVEQIRGLIPHGTREHKVLSFCFVDPFSVALQFRTIRRLATDRFIDFLILLALGMDANLNLTLYLQQEHQRIEEFVANPDWRQEWRRARERGHSFIPFLAAQYARAMTGLTYFETPLTKMYPARSDEKNLPLDYLAFFSRHKLGYDLWGQVLKYADSQLLLWPE
jgi:three-Cys-motif partner protein